MVQKIGPNSDKSSVRESIGIPGYLNTGVAPAYGTADSNGYVGVSQDYNSHANTTDRPSPASLKVEAPGEVEASHSSFAVDSDGEVPYETEVREDGTHVSELDYESDEQKAARERGLPASADTDTEGHKRKAAKKAPAKKLADQAKASDDK